MNSTQLTFYAATDRGRDREHNEDYHSFCSNLSLVPTQWSFFAHEAEKSSGERGSLLILADGMGGTNAGEVASKMAVESIQDFFDKMKEIPGDKQSFMTTAILECNKQLVAHQKHNPETRGMGTTLVIGWLLHNKLYLSWVGDSRAYCFNRNAGLFQLSKDHSLVQELIDKGEITQEQAFYHPHSNIITQSMGDGNRKPTPGFIEYNLQNNDRILLCSDGLNGMIQDREIENLIKDNPQIDTCGKELIAAANQAGGHDNITIVMCDVLSVDVISEPAAQKEKFSGGEKLRKSTFRGFSSTSTGILIVIALVVGIGLGATALYYFTKPAAVTDETEITTEEQPEAIDKPVEEPQEPAQSQSTTTRAVTRPSTGESVSQTPIQTQPTPSTPPSTSDNEQHQKKPSNKTTTLTPIPVPDAQENKNEIQDSITQPVPQQEQDQQ